MNNSIRDYLINIYDKLSHKATLLNGIALFKYLIKKEFYVNEKCNYIIKELNEQTNKLNGEDKKECLILLPYFFIHQISLKYITKILYILFSQINHTTETIFKAMTKIFGDILINVQSIQNQNSYKNIMTNTRLDNNNKYEKILLRLCLDLIDNNNLECIFKSKYHDFSLESYQQKCGFLFLGQFIENYNDIMNDNEILNIIINLLREYFYYLKNKNFLSRKEYLLCVNILINKLKKNFDIYAKELLNNIYLFDKILTYSPSSHKMINNDYIELKKSFLEIIYSLLIYNKNEFIDDYKKLLTYAKINKSSPNKEIRTISIKIIDIIIKENFTKDLNINVKNYISNDINNNNNYQSKTTLKERAFSFKNNESKIKKLISEDKKKYGDKKHNKKFIFVSQKSIDDSDDNIEEKNYFTLKKDNKIIEKKNYYENKSKEKDINNNNNNLNVVNLKIHEIKNMNDTMIKTVNNIENYLNNNFNKMEIKLNKIDNFQDIYKKKNKNKNIYIKKYYYDNNYKKKYFG